MPDRKVVRGGTHDRLRVVVPPLDNIKKFNVNVSIGKETELMSDWNVWYTENKKQTSW